jgi:hypothetical protein
MGVPPVLTLIPASKGFICFHLHTTRLSWSALKKTAPKFHRPFFCIPETNSLFLKFNSRFFKKILATERANDSL